MDAVKVASAMTSGRHAPRSSHGCQTCKTKKVKCNEQRPICARCDRLQLICSYDQRSRKSYSRRKTQKLPTIPQPRTNDLSITSSTAFTPTLYAEGQTADAIPDTVLQGLSPSPSGLHNVEFVATCSLVIRSRDREAIQYFRSAFARHHHTKNPQFNVLSVIYQIATQSAMVMHMLLAVAHREMLCVRSNGTSDDENDQYSVQHYTAVLRQMADFINDSNTTVGLDVVLSTTWLMLLYERNFGDARGTMLTNHLKGLASLVKTKARNALSFPSNKGLQVRPAPDTMILTGTIEDIPVLSLFSARMLVWIALIDAAAASTGLGGFFNDILHELLREHAMICDDCTSSSGLGVLKGFTEMQIYSNPLFSNVWNRDYPTREMIDDLENHKVFLLYGECCQLRYLSSRLPSLQANDAAEAEDYRMTIESEFLEIRRRHAELFHLADKLTINDDDDPRLVKNVRFIIPHYFATLLFYLRCAKDSASCWLVLEHECSIRMIMRLAFQAFKRGGDDAMLRIAWPIFMGSLEAVDPLHREWLAARLTALSKYGKNYSRAAIFAENFTRDQDVAGYQLDLWSRLTENEASRFTI